jgi:hypothetical protein
VRRRGESPKEFLQDLENELKAEFSVKKLDIPGATSERLQSFTAPEPIGISTARLNG